MSVDVTMRHGRSGVPVRTFRVDVVDGPDARSSSPVTGESVTVGTAKDNALLLTDPTVSRYHVELSARPGGVLVVDHGSTNGTASNGVRIERAFVSPPAVLEIGRTKLRVRDAGDGTAEVLEGDNLGGIRGAAPVMRRLMAQVEKAAHASVAVLVVGESGTGKELVARALHDLGPRAARPFVTVDCGALAPALIASELFGHERGAFTGADHRHVGAFERAEGGTVFLDEIGELPQALQPALLGALERRRFRRVGGTSEISADVRVVSASNRDLRSEVNAGTFRLDLYYRIAVVRLAVPPLRERADDVPLLVEHFAREAGWDEIGRMFSPEVLRALEAHHWPGNVRELKNLVEATLAMGETPALDAAPGPAAATGSDAIDVVLHLRYRDARQAVLAAFEKRYLGALLERVSHNVARAAREAQVDRTHLQGLLQRHGLK